MHGYRACGHYMRVPRVAISCVTIPRMAHDKLHGTCMFHATRKRGPRRHVMGLFKVLSWCHMCKNEVIIEWHRNHMANTFYPIETLQLQTNYHNHMNMP